MLHVYATLNGKWKFVGHVEEFGRTFFCHCPCTISPPILFLAHSLSRLASTHTCLLLKWPSEGPIAVCLCNSCDLCPSGSHLSMDCIGLWMSVASFASSHPSPEKQSDNRPEFNHRFLLACSESYPPLHRIMSGITSLGAQTMKRNNSKKRKEKRNVSS